MPNETVWKAVSMGTSLLNIYDASVSDSFALEEVYNVLNQLSIAGTWKIILTSIPNKVYEEISELREIFKFLKPRDIPRTKQKNFNLLRIGEFFWCCYWRMTSPTFLLREGFWVNPNVVWWLVYNEMAWMNWGCVHAQRVDSSLWFFGCAGKTRLKAVLVSLLVNLILNSNHSGCL